MDLLHISYMYQYGQDNSDGNFYLVKGLLTGNAPNIQMSPKMFGQRGTSQDNPGMVMYTYIKQIMF